MSNTENEKCERAERMIREAISSSEALEPRTIRVFTQGSYRNDTNVRNDSDVDIAVCCSDIFIPDFYLETSLNEAAIHAVDSDYTNTQFKDDVETALVDYFGAAGITRGDKAFDVHETSSRVDADVVACLEHRNYYRDSTGIVRYVWGTHIRTDSGNDIENYPEQHAEEGRKKNVLTANHFKRVVRIFKRLRNEMIGDDIEIAEPMASFLLESLVWNAPIDAFQNATYYEDVRAICLHLYEELNPEEGGTKWTEINKIKYLFSPGQPWSKEEVVSFVGSLWEYVDFE
jgi:hypothetical protein